MNAASTGLVLNPETNAVAFLPPVVAGIGDAGPESTPPATAERLDNLNSELVERINASGRAYLTQTKLRGRTVMRIGFGNVLTTHEHLRKAWELIRETAEAVGEKSQIPISKSQTNSNQ